jgi:hypothetical protein
MKTTLIMTLLFVLISCGTKEQEPVSSIPIQNYELIETYTNKLVLDQTTPVGLGTLLSLNKSSYMQDELKICTWFLVSKNMALTNSHCISDDLKNNPEKDCKEYLQGVIQTSSGRRTFTCKKLIHATKLSSVVVLDNDYALLELNENIDGVAPFELSRNGFIEDQKVHPLTMTHLKVADGFYSEFKKQTCLIKSSDLYGKISSPGSSPLTGFKEENSQDRCKSVSGNSGSPVTDEAGQLIGIVHGGINEHATPDPGIQVSMDKISKELTVMTNLRCQKFNHQNFDKTLPTTCAPEIKESKIDKEKLKKEIAPKFLKMIEDTQSLQPPYMLYNVATESINTSTNFRFKPACIKPLSQWDEASLEKIVSKGIFSNEKLIEAEIKNTSIEVFVYIDYYGNAKMDLIQRDIGTVHFEISGLKHLEKKEYAYSRLMAEKTGFENKKVEKVPLCEQ